MPALRLVVELELQLLVEAVEHFGLDLVGQGLRSLAAPCSRNLRLSRGLVGNQEEEGQRRIILSGMSEPMAVTMPRSLFFTTPLISQSACHLSEFLLDVVEECGDDLIGSLAL